jgi:hypothetical protein
MSEAEKNDLRQQLEELSRRLEARTRDFDDRGEFSDLHRGSVAELCKRQAELAHRVSAAEHAGTSWEMVKAEFSRDFSSLFDDFTQLEEKLDAGRMKMQR